MHEMFATGVLISESFLNSNFFIVLSAVVALNTTIYAALAVSKMFPKWLKPKWWRNGRKRAETRSIYPDAPR